MARIAILGLAAVALLTALIVAGVTEPLDQAVHRAMPGLRADSFIRTFGAIAGIGGVRGTLALSLLLGAVLIWRRRWAGLAGLAFVFFSIGAALNTLKPLVGRPRPEFGLVPEDGFSFPSGHAMATVAFWAYAWWSAADLGRGVRRVVGWIGIAVVAVTAFGRVYLGVHWLSDVAGGLAVGSVIAAGGILVARVRLRLSRASAHPVSPAGQP